MKTLDNRRIESETLCIDGKQFVDCIIINCVLEYRGGPVTFIRTHLKDCRYVFYGTARSTVHLLQCVGLMPINRAEWGEYSDTVN